MFREECVTLPDHYRTDDSRIATSIILSVEGYEESHRGSIRHAPVPISKTMSVQINDNMNAHFVKIVDEHGLEVRTEKSKRVRDIFGVFGIETPRTSTGQRLKHNVVQNPGISVSPEK